MPAGQHAHDHAGFEVLDGYFAFRVLDHDQRGLRCAAQERADFTTGAPHGIVLHRPGGGKKKKKESAFPPRADEGGAGSHGKHEKVDVELPRLETLPRIAGGVPSAAKISKDIGDKRGPGGSGREFEGPAGEAEKRAARGQGGHGSPLRLAVLLEGALLARRIGRPDEFDPLPERDGGDAGGFADQGRAEFFRNEKA